MQSKEHCCHCGVVLNFKGKRKSVISLARRLKGSEETCVDVCGILFGSVPREIKDLYNLICYTCYGALGQLRRTHKRWNDLAGPKSVFKGIRTLNNQPSGGHKLARPNNSSSHPQTQFQVPRRRNKCSPLKQALLKHLSSGSYSGMVRLIYNQCNNTVKANVRKTMQSLVRKELSSAKLSYDPNNPLEEPFSWEAFLIEVNESVPLLYSLVTAALTTAETEKKMKTTRGHTLRPIQGVVLSTILHQNYPMRIRSFQTLNGLQLFMSGAECRAAGHFNKLGLSVSYNVVRRLCDDIAKSFEDEVMAWRSKWENSNWNSVRKGDSNMQVASTDNTTDVAEDNLADVEIKDVQPNESVAEVNVSRTNPEEEATLDCMMYTFCFNNMKTSTKVRHDVSDRQHMLQTYAILDRIPLPATAANDDVPSADDILSIPLSSYLPTRQDIEEDFKERKRIVGQILAKWINCFRRKRKKLGSPIAHQYSAQSADKSKMIPLGAQSLKNECLVGDAINHLSQLEEFIPKINSPAEKPTKVLIFGDHLSCKLMQDAKRTGISESDTSEGLEQFEVAVADHHKCVQLLQDAFDELLVEESVKSIGSLAHMQNVLKQKNPKSPVKASFDNSFAFMEALTECYIVAAALDHLNMDDIGDDLGEGDTGMVKEIFEEVCDHVTKMGTEVPSSLIGEISKYPSQNEYEYCLCKEDIGGDMLECQNSSCPFGKWFHPLCLYMSEEDIPNPKRKWYCSTNCRPRKKVAREGSMSNQDSMEDSMYEYTRAILWHGLTTLSRRDAIQENDGPRIIRHWKYDIIQFARLHHYNNFKLGVNLLTSVLGGSSKRIIHQLTWCRTVNPTGQPGGNIPVDLQMENFKEGFRENCLRTSAGHLIDKAIVRSAKLAGTYLELEEMFSKSVLESTPRSDKLITTEEEMANVISTLKSSNLFKVIPGQSHSGITNFKFKPFNIETAELEGHLQREQKNIANTRKEEIGSNRLGSVDVGADILTTMSFDES